jgi:hypothetical protein
MQRCAAVGHARAACNATEVLTQDLQQRHHDVQCMRGNLNQEHGLGREILKTNLQKIEAGDSCIPPVGE